jgi:hypothetical protein
MNDKRLRRVPSFASAAVLASLASLTACGGGDGGDGASDGTAAATNDIAEVAWNTSTPVDVTANDVVEHGKATLAVTSPPTHGTAVVEGGQIRYTPKAGYFGGDTLRYRLTAGGKTSDAEVRIAIKARFAIEGRVGDEVPLAKADVVATVGNSAQFATKADADGKYRVTIDTAAPVASIHLRARGVGAQSKVVLSGIVADAGDAVAHLSSQGVLGADAMWTTNVTYMTTAIAAAAQQALGRPPEGTADMTRALGRFTSDQAIEAATAIRMVAYEGQPLPEKIEDTKALASDPHAMKTFVAGQKAHNAAAYAKTRQAVLADRRIALPAPVPAPGAAAKSFVLVHGWGPGASSASRVTLRGDHAATVEGDAPRKATWRTDGTEVSVVFDQPRQAGNSTADDGTGTLRPVRVSEDGFKLRQVGGGAANGTVTLTPIARHTWLNGPHAGTTTDAPDHWDASSLVADTSDFTAEEFSMKKKTDLPVRFAGVISPDFAPSTPSTPPQDSVRIVDDSHLVFERSGRRAGWSLVDGKFVITTPDGVYTYTRVFYGPRDEERWLMQKSVDGVLSWTYEGAAFKHRYKEEEKHDTVPYTFMDVALAGRWDDYRFQDGEPQRAFDLGDNGSLRIETDPVQGSVLHPGHWSLDDDGLMQMNDFATCEVGAPACEPDHTHAWALLGFSAKRIYVMERQVQRGGEHPLDTYRVNVLERSED